jgi:ADP-heptose:LPS heptosyltransferase
MKNFKQLGIYMDHAHAFLMELENGMILSRNIVSGWIETEQKPNQDNHFMGFNCGEKKHLQSAYYHEISEIIRHYQQVVLFGPTDAKNELNNLLKVNHLFNEIKIEIVDTDKFSNEQMHEFMKEYFK